MNKSIKLILLFVYPTTSANNLFVIVFISLTYIVGPEKLSLLPNNPS